MPSGWSRSCNSSTSSTPMWQLAVPAMNDSAPETTGHEAPRRVFQLSSEAGPQMKRDALMAKDREPNVGPVGERETELVTVELHAPCDVSDRHGGEGELRTGG